MILDTSALSAYLDKTPASVEIVAEAREITISVIVIGEFAFGIAKSRHREAYGRSLRRMLGRCTVLGVGIETVRHYAAIRLELKGAGTQIPADAAWIAALSRQHAIPVMSRDTHFDFVSGLKRLPWQEEGARAARLEDHAAANACIH